MGGWIKITNNVSVNHIWKFAFFWCTFSIQLQLVSLYPNFTRTNSVGPNVPHERGHSMNTWLKALNKKCPLTLSLTTRPYCQFSFEWPHTYRGKPVHCYLPPNCWGFRSNVPMSLRWWWWFETSDYEHTKPDSTSCKNDENIYQECQTIVILPTIKFDIAKCLVSLTKLCPALPMHITRIYTNFYCSMLYAVPNKSPGAKSCS